MSDKQELLNKIKALAERGVGGEKETAIKMYNKLLKKYGIKEDELDDDKVENYEFHYNSVYERRLIAQIIHSVIDSNEIYVPKDNRHNYIHAYMTKAQYLECRSMIDFYVVLLHDTLVKATIAFINVEHIFSKSAGVSDEPPDPELLGMISSLHKHHRYTQIEDKSKFIESEDNN